MPLPYLNAPEQSVEMITQFGGYNHRMSIAENQFYDMKNMSSKDYPLASTRNKRGIISNEYLKDAQAIVAKDNIVFAYTKQGNIGVKIKNDVAKREKEYPAPDPEQEILYTTICTHNQNDLLAKIGYDLSNYTRYTIKNDSLNVATGDTPIIDGQTLKVQYEHGKIPETTHWAKHIFTLVHWYSLDQDHFSVKSNDFLDDEENRKKLIGKTVWINGTKSATIKSIEKPSVFFPWHDWTFIFTSNLKNGDENANVYIRLTEPISADIPEGKYSTVDGVKLNLPSEVEVATLSEFHLKVLEGQTVAFKDANGEHLCNVVGYRVKDGKSYIDIAVPHDALQSGATAEGDRLYLAEIDPLTNQIVSSSDIVAASPNDHTIIEMGANVVIFPEKVMVNTQKFNSNGQYTDIQQLELRETISNCFMRLTDANGNGFVDDGKEKCSVGNTAPLNPSDGWGWIDTSENPPTFKIYSEQIEQWAKTQTYCEIRISDGAADTISEEWQVGDAVELEFEDKNIIGDAIVPIAGQKYFVISAVKGSDGTKCVRFPVAMKKAIASTDKTLTIKRTVPDMDFVIENENRLWGCKYGEVDGEPINEIFACKLGDPKNWHHFTNTAMDSYYVSLGADGEFTGAVSYAGNPFFFREGCIHRIYGNYPSNYALKTINCHGVESGSGKGITVMNDVMYYKSPVGIMAYTGATPVNISEHFGTERYKNAVAGAVGSKMYFSMVQSDESNALFVFDDNTKLWHKEDDIGIRDMVTYDNGIYALSTDNELVAMEGEAGTLEDDFEWSLTSGNIGYNTPFFKHIARLNIRMLLERGSRASLYIQYDSDGNWHHISNLQPAGKVKNMSVPVSPQRCDHFALKFEGRGTAKILSITKFTEGGSENE